MMKSQIKVTVLIIIFAFLTIQKIDAKAVKQKYFLVNKKGDKMQVDEDTFKNAQSRHKNFKQAICNWPFDTCCGYDRHGDYICWCC